ncbi:helix-turn-helix domain-containing protein [Filimonas effusa]|uniref:helix-turn-helix domain-containing protein n=1 Tax=Filimonas effusa TaxID=2508721 RepID=UPI0038B320A0
MQSISAFKQHCREELGIPPAEFVRLQCLEWAAELLLHNPGTMVEEIVWQVGYRDVDNFREHFKAHFKQTPTAWRQNCSRE